MSISSKLHIMRDHRGLSQEQLAQKSGVGRSTISLIEHGKITAPGAGVLEGLAKGTNQNLRTPFSRVTALSFSCILLWQ